jgi:hypothetical protein
MPATLRFRPRLESLDGRIVPSTVPGTEPESPPAIYSTPDPTTIPTPTPQEETPSALWEWVNELFSIPSPSKPPGPALVPVAGLALYGNGQGPDWTSVQQGALNNCWFVTAAMGVARTDPAAIKNLIADNGDGTYTVTFPGKEAVTITYDPNAKGSTSDGIWLRVLEQSAAKFLNIDAGARPRMAIDFLTGSSTNVRTKNFSGIANWRDKISTAVTNNKIAIVCTPKGAADVDGIVLNHAYLVIGYDAATDKVQLRNPWGRQDYTGPGNDPTDLTDDGVFTMPLTDLYRIFQYVDYQE